MMRVTALPTPGPGIVVRPSHSRPSNVFQECIALLNGELMEDPDLDEAVELYVPPMHPVYPRIDLVIHRYTLRQVEVICGVPRVTPLPPAIPAEARVIARIVRLAGFSTVLPCNIQNMESATDA